MSKMTECPKVKDGENFVFFIHTPYKGPKGSGKKFHDVTETGTLWKKVNKNSRSTKNGRKNLFFVLTNIKSFKRKKA
jgi:hypothetical protein